jgi:2-polyprenyl-3-methyl-5-hydroxy-6-metoxy-1,4-benzoquinol methylase
MRFEDGHRTYYDHEGPYRQIAAKGGVGWDDLAGNPGNDSYAAVQEFLDSPFAATLGAGKAALDLGCGGGQVAIMFAGRGCVTHGIDYSPTAIVLAKANAREAGLHIDFREGDCLTLKDYADRSMDVVADNHTWHCLVEGEDRGAFLRAAFRVLKPGGVMFSETMTREGDFSAAAVDADPRTFVSRHQNRYWVGRAEALEELKSAGFEIIKDRLKPQEDLPGVGELLVVYARRA